MKTRHWMVVGGLLALVALAVVGLFLTRDMGDANSPRARRNPKRQYVDQSPLQTARKLAAAAATRDEQRYARQALRLADHEVDLAFAVALRQAAEQQTAPTPQTRGMVERVNKAQAALKNDQELVDRIKKQAGAAAQSDAAQEKLNLAEAQLELDEDELEDAQGDLMRSGANTQGWIQRQFDRYQASQKESDASLAQSNSSTPETSYLENNLFAKFGAWRGLRGKAGDLQAAHDDSLRAADALKQEHDALEGQLSAQESNKQELKQKVASQLNSGAGGGSGEALAALRQLAREQKNLADLDKRIQDHTELGDVYTNWIGVVQAEERTAIHAVLQSLVWILLIVLVAYVVGRLIDGVLAGHMQERKGLLTLRMILRFSVQALAVLLIVFALFGMPAQMPTMLGLAGAGLTVALKDFIVAFFGWFVLMGKNGIRVGDWVEINGVVGEVVEINLLRTVLLETGNWTDTGHPTGRKVAFVNSFAIEGHFFNFSTSGQWLWDELEILIPTDQNPYPLTDAILKLVTAETADNARKAEEEWKNSVSGYRVQSVSATPAINLRPTTLGVELRLRYITNANERYVTRAKLYQAVVELLHGKHGGDVAEASEVKSS